MKINHIKNYYARERDAKNTNEIEIRFNILQPYSDADYAKDTCTRRSLTGYVLIKNGAAVTWATQRKQSVALSTTESESMAACSAIKEAIWLKGLLSKLILSKIWI